MSDVAGTTQLKAALSQLETALMLYLDGNDFLSVITLAGAAGNLLGPMVKEMGGAHSLAGNAKAYAWLVERFHGVAIDERAATTDLNDARDWLKHYKPGSLMGFDSKVRAQEMLERAVYNALFLTGNETGLMRRFHLASRT